MILQGFGEGNPILQLVLTLFFLFLLCIFITKIGDKVQLLSIRETVLLIFVSLLPSLIYLLILILIEGLEYVSADRFVVMIGIGGSLLIITNTVIKIVIFRTSSRYIFENRIIEKRDTEYILINVKELQVFFSIYGGFFKQHIADVQAVNGVSFSIRSGSTVALVGESGCGKTTIAKAILGLLTIKSGEIIFKNQKMDYKKNRKEIRKYIQMVFQDPEASLNPRMNVFENIAEPLKNLYGLTDKNILREKVLDAMEQVSLNREHMDRYPHEFSGGQKQRIIISRALICQPELIILDEPTSSLDVSVQAQILNLLKEIQRNFGFGYLFITHDLAVVHHIADEVLVMYLGKIVERGTKDDIFENPSHPYTQGLLASKSSIDPEHRGRSEVLLEGEVPSPINPPKGCNFHPRCKSHRKTSDCSCIDPVLIKMNETHFMWCREEKPITKD